MLKRGQVTIFIIIGILILILTGFYLAFQSSIRETPTPDAHDFNSVRVYMESALEQYSEHSLFLVGQRGGYIRKIDILYFPLKLENSNISTGINRINNFRYGTMTDGGYTFAERPPEYPWSGLENTDSIHFVQDYKIGSPRLIPLVYPPTTTAPSVRTEIEDYLEDVIDGLNVDVLFDEYNINTSAEPEVKVIFADGTTSFRLNYPLNVTHKGTNTLKTMEHFEAELPINFKKFYSFIEEVVFQETSYLKFKINDHTGYSQLPSYPENNPNLDFSVNLEEVDDDFDIITFIYHSEWDDDYYFQIAKQRLIPAMYDLTPKNYIDNGVQKEYNLSGIYLNKVNNEPDGIGSSYTDDILNYIKDPDDVENQAIDPNKPGDDEDLEFSYGKVGDCFYDDYLIGEGILEECPSHDSIEFEVDEDTGEFEINCPNKHINVVNYTCETRVFVRNQADSEVEDYESVYFDYFCKECINYPSCGGCKECCWGGCCMDDKCHEPGEGICSNPDEKNKPDLSTVERGDTENSMDSLAVQSLDFLEEGDVVDTWDGDCIETDDECMDDCLEDPDNSFDDCEDSCCEETKDCCEYCVNPCSGYCSEYD